jgi:hypothetical protein
MAMRCPSLALPLVLTSGIEKEMNIVVNAQKILDKHFKNETIPSATAEGIRVAKAEGAKRHVETDARD